MTYVRLPLVWVGKKIIIIIIMGKSDKSIISEKIIRWRSKSIQYVVNNKEQTK